MTPRHLVVSAVNFTEGGPLTILIDSLDTAAATLGPEWTITALVHNEGLVQNPRIHKIEFPMSKQGWLNRLWLEWWQFKKVSRKIKPDLWLSLHDVTPRVTSSRQAVYCHNPSPFYRAGLTESRFDPKFFVFNKLYIYLYRIFSQRNYAVIVQADWLREALRLRLVNQNIVVARPTKGDIATANQFDDVVRAHLRTPTIDEPLRLLYPALPRVFKNIEVLCEAMKQIPADLIPLIDLRLTLDGSENRWARRLVEKYGTVPGVSMIGRQSRSQMDLEYNQCDAVLFPSRLETWGLPITEAKTFRKPLLAADLPYAHETAGDYDTISFAPASDARSWAEQITQMATGKWHPQGNKARVPEQPFAEDWPALWRYLVDGL